MCKRFLVLVLIGLALGAIWFEMSRVAADDLPPLQTGDLLFQTTNTPQTLAIMAASGTVYSHTAIAHMHPDGTVTVIEAADPVREVSLQQWIEQGIGGRITIKRFAGLYAQQADKVIAAAKSHMGKAYDYLFRFDKGTIYCSELVYYAFQDGAGIDLGDVEKIRELNTNNFAVRRVIEQRWQDHPACQQAGADNLAACYDLIMSQTLITPVSVANDDRLELVYSNYTPF